MNENFTSGLAEKFIRNCLDSCGDDGRKWLEELPEIIDEIAVDWSLKVDKPFLNLSYNFVAPCVLMNESEAVLKIALPLENSEIFNEASFLQMASGKGAVKLLDIDRDNRAILIERLKPGANLKTIFRKDKFKAIEVAIQTMQKIVKKAPENSSFRSLEDWFKGFERAENTKFPREFVNKAYGFFKESGSKQEFLIHADLHHENILSAEREPFLAIDPKGIIGNIGYEIAVFLNNHLWWLASEMNLKDKLNYAIQQFSEAFEISQEDLRRWAFAQIVLSAWWTFDENGKNWESELDFAKFWEV
jgi:streptomycin 6-kinase